MSTAVFYEAGTATPRPRNYARVFLGPHWPSSALFENQSAQPILRIRLRENSLPLSKQYCLAPHSRNAKR